MDVDMKDAFPLPTTLSAPSASLTSNAAYADSSNSLASQFPAEQKPQDPPLNSNAVQALTGSSSQTTGNSVPNHDEPQKEDENGNKGEDKPDDGSDEDEEEEEEDEEDYLSDDDEYVSVTNPSNDIRGDFEKALEGSLDFKGSFSFSKTYPDAPNPVLQLADIGTIGLPLSEREAQVLKSRCIQAPFGQGERTIVDTNVRDTWEMDASSVRFGNSAQWKAFIDKLAAEVCTTLGVNVAASNPRAELYKLLLYETGSHFLPHQDTEKSNGMFATIIIVLPSLFTGGEAYLSHGALPPKVIDCSSSSLTQTTVLSWYTDVTHEIKPITSGHRLALSYNLIHTRIGSLPPSMPSNSSTIEKIRHVLLSWNQKARSDEEGTPTKLIYLLEHKYGKAGLKGGALKGIDAHKLTVLDLLCRQHNFHIGLASVECHQTGYADDDGGGYYGRRRGGWYDPYSDYDEDGLDDDDVGMAEVEETHMSITGLVDLDGGKLSETLAGNDDEEDLEESGECIPSDLRETVESGGHDEQQYEGYMGNGAGSLERWYRRTVLVVWPDHYHFQVAYGSGNEAYALSELKDAISTARRPGARERRLIRYMLSGVARGYMSQEAVFGGLCTATCYWEDPAHWKIAIEGCRAGDSLVVFSPNLIFKSIEAFGFEIVRPTIEDALKNERSNTLRYNFLKEIKEHVYNQSPDPILKSWVEEQRQNFARTLKTPTHADQSRLVQLALEEGGVTFLAETLLPQIKTLADANFKLQFAVFLYSEKAKFTGTDQDWQTLKHVIEELLLAAIANLDLFKPSVTPQQPAYSSWNRPESKPGPETAFGCFEKCLQTGNAALIGALVERLVNPSGLENASMQSRASHVLLPLIARIQTHLKSASIPASSVSGLEKLCHIAVAWYMDRVGLIPCKPDMTNVLEAVILSGSPALSLMFVAKLKSSPISGDGGVLRDFIEELQARRAEVQLGADLDAMTPIVKELVNIVSQRATLQSCGSIVSLLEFCLKTNSGESCTLVIRRALDPANVTNHYITQVLIPLISETRRVLVKYKIPLSTPPFSTLLRSTMVVWIKKLLGPKPAQGPSAAALASLQKLTCTCDCCLRVKKFLTSSPDRHLQLQRIGAPKRKHVESYLFQYARTAATFTTVRTTPQGLQIVKTDLVYLPIKWKAEQKTGQNILGSISSNHDDLKAIFGADYFEVMNTLGVRATATAGNPTASQPASRPVAVATGNGNIGPPSHAVLRSSPVPPQDATSSRPTATASLQTPAKRKLPIEDDDIIDLTTP